MAAGIAELFEVVIDGVVAEREHLAGKPVPDTFVAGARALGLEPAQAASLRTRSPAPQAGRAGCFGVVIGVDRVD
jgi:beta-phosphoglucomutase-like phosphatase (HAD superfamily)